MRRETWPLVGRADELSYVARTLEERRAVLLAGAAGVGKSRLASEVRDALAADGWSTVAVSVGTDSASVPFAPFASLLGEDAAGDGVDRILRATHALEARGERVLVSVDDAHLLDDVSVAFLRHLLAATTVHLLFTARSGVAAPDGLQSLWQSGALHRIEVQPLSQAEVAELLERVLGASVDLAVVRWVWVTSEGNALFVRELVLDAVDRGTLVSRDGRWTLASPSTGPGSRLLEVVAGRIGDLPAEDHAALELLAVGEPLGLHMFEDLAGEDVVLSLERRGLVRTTLDEHRAQVHLAHPLHGEVLRDGLGVTAARRHLRRLIAAVDATGAKRVNDPLRLATWRCEVGDTEDWRPLLDAANDLSKAFERPLAALWTGDRMPVDAIPVGRGHLEVALRLARAAFDAGGSIDAGAATWALLMRLGRREEALALDAELDRLAVTEADRVRAARMRADAAFAYGTTELERAVADLRALASDAIDPSSRVAAQSTLAQMLVIGRSMREAATLGFAALDDPAASRHDGITAATAAATAIAELGRTEEAVAVLDRLAATVTAEDDSTALGLFMAVRVIVLVYASRYVEAEQLASLGMQVSVASGADDGAAIFAAELASIVLALGRPATAARFAGDVTARLAETDVFGVRRSAIVSGTHAHALLGNLVEVEMGLVALDHEPHQDRWAADDEIRARAWADVARGRASAALARLQAGAERAALEERSTRELNLLHDLVRLGHAHVVVDRVEELVDHNDCPTTALIAAQARGIVDGDADLLATAAEGFAALGCRLWEAEAWAQAAVVLGGEGKKAAASGAAARSRAAVAECEGAVTPALSIGGAADNLTAREREIAGLAARGLTDKQIADELVVSIRTVQTHLYNAYAKLGIDGRSQLAGVLT